MPAASCTSQPPLHTMPVSWTTTLPGCSTGALSSQVTVINGDKRAGWVRVRQAGGLRLARTERRESVAAAEAVGVGDGTRSRGRDHDQVVQAEPPAAHRRAQTSA